ncbi:hypothetical protein L210DRAFT_2541445 [Boletus edulis BED1]|uniref:Uncharacterized protein n=1 Tax=Boletus edulis BED1 TaxID=1328754 RepID=A0AAD4BMA5_BOLED|nr:hypothetical protein L210DRAFT_2541445 [Boletus edulis BED1]
MSPSIRIPSKSSVLSSKLSRTLKCTVASGRLPRTIAESQSHHPRIPKEKGSGRTRKEREKKKQKLETCSFIWTTFPAEPIDEDALVIFLNEITDRALDFARPKLASVVPTLNNRFAARSDKNHAMPLSYEPDGEDIRPDFLLLPVQVLSDDFKTVNPRYRYLKFTASRLVGEAKNKDLASGVERVQGYARGLKRAQPWVHAGVLCKWKTGYSQFLFPRSREQ